LQTDNLEIGKLLTSVTKQQYYSKDVQGLQATWVCVQYVHNSLARHTATDASTGRYCHQWTAATERTTPAQSPASIVPRTRTFCFIGAFRRTILNCYASQRVWENCCCTHQKSSNYVRSFKCYKQKCQLVPL